jgi:SAM-dependent methyltransferase
VWFKHIRIRIQNSLFGNARSRLIRQTQKVIPAGRLLDIGCGTGSLLKEASKFYDCTGLEPSDRAADAAESEGFQVIRSTVENAQIPDDAFDVVTMDAVLEHVPDPVAVLQQIHRILRPGGIVVIKVPKLWGPSHRRHGREWNGFRVGYHLTMFTGKTLSAALEVAGFTPLSQPSRDRWLDDILVLWGRQQPVSSTRISAA